jgi:hypothetical protein
MNGRMEWNRTRSRSVELSTLISMILLILLVVMSSPTPASSSSSPPSLSSYFSSPSFHSFIRSPRSATAASLLLSSLFFLGLFLSSHEEDKKFQKFQQEKLIEKERQRRAEIKKKIIEDFNKG